MLGKKYISSKVIASISCGRVVGRQTTCRIFVFQ